MTPEELATRVRRLRALGSDDATTEAKAAVGDLPKGVWRSISAFANTGGGHIVLGLDESSGFELATGFDPGRIIDKLSDGLNPGPGKQPKITPVPPHEIEQVEFEGGVVVVLEVGRLAAKPAPCFVTERGVENGSFRRWDDQDIRLSSYEIYQLRYRDERLEIDREPVPGASMADLDEASVSRLLTKLSSQSSLAIAGTTSVQEQLHRLNVVDAQGTPTLAGLLSLGSYPQQFFPQLFVDVATHPSRVKAAAGTPVRFLDRRVCEGSIPAAVEQAVQAVLMNLRTVRVVEGTHGRDMPEIPEDVLREAIVNAVTHRDYSSQVIGQQVAVDIFPDRVEVTNPGGFWGGVTPENIDRGRSCSRNDALAKMLTRVPLPNSDSTVCENQGSGVLRMMGAMKDRGLPVPHFEGAIDQVKVVLHRFGLLTPDTREWLSRLASRTLSPHQEMALVLARTVGTVTPQDLRREAAMDTDDAREDLDQLRSLGLLEEIRPDEFRISDAGSLNEGQRRVLGVLSPREPMTIHEIAAATGRSAGHLRSVIRDLVDAGMVIATAPPTSRNRAYLRFVDKGDEGATLPLR